MVEGLRSPGEAVGLQPVPPRFRWPSLRIHVERARGPRPAETFVSAERAVLVLVDGEHIEVDRAAGSVVIHAARELDEHDVVHPYLAWPASVLAEWHGRTVVHGGGIVGRAGGWALLGGKRSGKSTLLAWLHHAGVPVLADDMVVLEDGQAFAGPRTLDLRPGSPLPALDDDARAVRGGGRRRLQLPPVPARVPFSGWIVLEGGDEMRLTELRPADRLAVLSAHLSGGRGDRIAVLDHLAAPMWRLVRPRDPRAMPGVVDLLREHLGL